MRVRFHHSGLVESSLETIVEVLTDYVRHPDLDPTLWRVTVVWQDEAGAELVLDRRSRLRRQVHALDRYHRDGDVTLERMPVGESATRTTWTVHRISTRRSRLSVEAGQELPAHRAFLLRPLLRRDFHRFDVTPFVIEAERRTVLDARQP
jgi:hypothetical protein